MKSKKSKIYVQRGNGRIRQFRHSAANDITPDLPRLAARRDAADDILAACANGDLPDICEEAAAFLIRTEKAF